MLNQHTESLPRKIPGLAPRLENPVRRHACHGDGKHDGNDQGFHVVERLGEVREKLPCAVEEIDQGREERNERFHAAC